MGVFIRDDVVVDEELAVAPCHGGDDGVENIAAFVVGPVVEDGVEVICACSLAVDEKKNQPHVPFV